MSAPIVSLRGVSVRAAPWDTPVQRHKAPEPVPVVVAPPAPNTCRVPGCGRTIRFDNRQGVCRTHSHAKGFCNCIQCQRRDK
jgi:hypothetical protein